MEGEERNKSRTNSKSVDWPTEWIEISFTEVGEYKKQSRCRSK